MSTFLERIRRYKDDRGYMANLRCILVESKKHRAWAALSRLGIGVDNVEESFVAGLFASHPEVIETGNFGDTCRLIDRKRGETDQGDQRDTKLSPVEKRFQQLLSSERSELNSRVLRLALMAKSHNIPINYGVLVKDLRFWGDHVKRGWAGSFWGRSSIQKNEEETKEE